MNLRLISAGVLNKVIKDGQSLTMALDRALEGIDHNKDSAFVQMLCYGVARQYQRLDYMLQQLLDKPLRNIDSDIKMLLLIGIFQLNNLRVKPHAAVSETVAAARKKSWAKSLINGVLRQFIREQETLNNQADQHPSAQYSHPSWLMDKISHDWPDCALKIFQENNKQAPMALRVNLAKNKLENYLMQLDQQAISASTLPFSDSAIVLKQAVAVEKLPGFSSGLVSVQDTAAQLAAVLLDVQDNHLVLDLCAAPGGKTAAILERYGHSVSVLAVDIDKQRLNRVKDNLQRLNLQATLLAADASEPATWSGNQFFDRILLDAPCSATGVIRRHPDIKILRRESDIDALQALQTKILNAAWKLLKPRGILLYATCSILKQENVQQIEGFLNNHADASEISIHADWGIKTSFGRQIITGDCNMDGFYYAKLLKT